VTGPILDGSSAGRDPERRRRPAAGVGAQRRGAFDATDADRLARRARRGPRTTGHYRRNRSRRGPNAARSSPANRSGCSQAAK
jgi:hypothetical protein